ncbi:MAG: uroporphyrinogen-III synthase, partial [Eubacteriales bacterium]|nr:uroporphyrinogen-III synthase [Eubacteriales bacterium]
AQEQSADAPAAAPSGRQIKILLPRAVKGDGVFAARMAEAGAVVTEIRIYDVRGGAMDEERRRSVEEGRLDAIVLFSTSGAAALTEALRSAGLPLPRRMRYYCMGERTAAALRERLEEETEGSTAAALQRLLEAAHGGTIPEIIVPPLCTMAGMAAEIRSVQV